MPSIAMLNLFSNCGNKYLLVNLWGSSQRSAWTSDLRNPVIHIGVNHQNVRLLGKEAVRIGHFLRSCGENFSFEHWSKLFSTFSHSEDTSEKEKSIKRIVFTKTRKRVTCVWNENLSDCSVMQIWPTTKEEHRTSRKENIQITGLVCTPLLRWMEDMNIRKPCWNEVFLSTIHQRISFKTYIVENFHQYSNDMRPNWTCGLVHVFGRKERTFNYKGKYANSDQKTSTQIQFIQGYRFSGFFGGHYRFNGPKWTQKYRWEPN